MRKTSKKKEKHEPLVLEGHFLVINKRTGKCIDVMDWSPADHAGIQQYPPHGGDNQRWQFIPATKGRFEIVAAHSGKCLDDGNSSKENGGLVHQWTRHNGSNQIWELTPTGDGCFYIKSNIGGLCLDASPDGTTVHLWSLHREENQKWRLEPCQQKEQNNVKRGVSSKETSKMDNTLDLSAAFAVYGGHVDLIRLESDRLCWVAEAGPSAGLPLRTIIEGQMLPLLNGKGPSRDEISKTIREASTQIQGLLEEQRSIFCDIRLNFVLEEQEQEAFGKFAERMQIEDAEEAINSLRTSCGLGFVEFVDIKEVSTSKASEISETNFELHNPEIHVLPGKEVCFVLCSKEPVICREFQLFCRGNLVLRHQTPVHFDANSKRTIRLPSIPVTMYRHLLWEQAGELRVHAVLAGRDEAIVIPQALRHQHLEINRVPVSLFLDVGSAYSKFMVVEIAADFIDTEIAQSELETRLRRALKSGVTSSAEHIFLADPQATQIFSDNHGLSHTPKKILDAYGDERLAAHFASSISELATHFYKRENRLISDIFWAFPNTEKRNFVQISETLNRTLGGTIMGAVKLIPEADCLRSEFAGVLNALADAAKGAVQSKADAEKQNRKTEEAKERIREAWDGYQNRPWYEKAWIKVKGGKPTDPSHSGLSYLKIPSLEDWHSEFSRLECDELLSDFLVFDAGGYSLDVYGTFSDKASEIISQSFKAGSAKINATITAQLRKDNPGCSGQEYADTAEDIKCAVCSDPRKNKHHAFFQLCQTSTKKVYEEPIRTILTIIKQRSRGKGFPIILTGGGSRNQFLHELLDSMLASMDIDTVPISSPLLYSTMRRAGGAKSTELNLFLCMASAFHPNEEFPRMAPVTDILGGLAHHAYKE